MQLIEIKKRFSSHWRQYFPGAELPIVFYYSDKLPEFERQEQPQKHRCLICDLAKVRRGRSLVFDRDNLGCAGASRYLGFTREGDEDLAIFLSCGREGEFEGLRFKKTPELVMEYQQSRSPHEAPADYAIFRRWDQLEDSDEPQVVTFFANPDVLSGLYTLFGFEQSDPDAVIAPFGAGCATILQYPYQESLSDNPRAVLGMFDISARPCVAPDLLTFSVPWSGSCKWPKISKTAFSRLKAGINSGRG